MKISLCCHTIFVCSIAIIKTALIIISVIRTPYQALGDAIDLVVNPS